MCILAAPANRFTKWLNCKQPPEEEEEEDEYAAKKRI